MTLALPDPWLAAVTIYVFILGGIGGWAICQVTHKQRGMEVDRPLTDNLPLPPPPVVVPDHVPDDWATPRNNQYN